MERENNANNMTSNPRIQGGRDYMNIQLHTCIQIEKVDNLIVFSINKYFHAGW